MTHQATLYQDLISLWLSKLKVASLKYPRAYFNFQIPYHNPTLPYPTANRNHRAVIPYPPSIHFRSSPPPPSPSLFLTFSSSTVSPSLVSSHPSGAVRLRTLVTLLSLLKRDILMLLHCRRLWAASGLVAIVHAAVQIIQSKNPLHNPLYAPR